MRWISLALYNSDGLRVIFMVYQLFGLLVHGLFLNAIVGTFYQYLLYLQN